MAGIGFELKKIFKNQSFSSLIKGFSYSAIVSTGPMLMSILMLVIIGQILKRADVPIMDRELVNAAIMYAFIFSMINVSGLSMAISRYIADELFVGQVDKVLVSLVGVLAINLPFSGLAGILFFARSPLPDSFKIFSYLLFMELSVMYLLMVYVSAIKNYKRIVLAFGVGTLLTILLSIVLTLAGAPLTIGILAAVDVGYLVNIVIQLTAIRQAYNHMADHVFAFMRSIMQMPRLIYINLLYSAGLFVHNILLWYFSGISVQLYQTFTFAPSYDTATFFAVLTILPSAVIFVYKAETSFYDKYSRFCNAILHGGNLKSIDQAKENMLKVLVRELSSIFEIQFCITVFLLITGSNLVLPLLGADSQTVEIYSVLAISYFITYMANIITTILLYFNNQEDALKTMIIFLSSTSLFTIITIWLGERFYGLGLGAGALVTIIFAANYLKQTMEEIDYRLFSKPAPERKS